MIALASSETLDLALARELVDEIFHSVARARFVRWVEDLGSDELASHDTRHDEKSLDDVIGCCTGLTGLKEISEPTSSESARGAMVCRYPIGA